jgi:YD repeat-containing protein
MIRFLRTSCFAFFAICNFFIEAHANADIPNHYQEPGLYPNRDYLNHHIGEFIDPFQGSLQLQHVDLVLPGNGGFDLKVQRSYNLRSKNSQGPFGLGWDIHFGRVQKPNFGACGLDAQTKLTLQLEDGSNQSFFKSAIPSSGASTFLTTRFWRGECFGGGMIVYSPDGTRYEMLDVTTDSFNVTKITDRNGNYATFTYGFAGSTRVVTSVTASDGRSITFNYSAGTTGVLTSITANGRTWTYAISNIATIGVNYRLTAVTPPIGNGWSYTYYADRATVAGSYALKSVQYPQGGVVTYDYGFVTFLQGVVGVTPTVVVTSKVTSDGTWTFGYQPTTATGQYDVTTVTLPNGIGQITYKHFGYWTAREAWKVGLLYQKISGSAETETYSWEPQIISDEPFARFGYAYIDFKVIRPLLASVSRARDGGTFTTSYSTRDVYGNPQSIAETGTKSRTTTKGYFNDTTAWIIGLTSSESVTGVSGSTSRTIQAATGNVLSESRFGVTNIFTYWPHGGVNTRTDPRGFVTTYSDYFRGIPRTESRPEGVAITRAVDYFGKVTQDSDGESSWLYGYDALNRVASITFPTGAASTISWNASSTAQSVTRGAYSGNKSFDSYGRKVAENKGGIALTSRVDALGRTTFQSLPGSTLGATYTLDILGRPTSISRPEGTTGMGYSAGNVTVTNPRTFATTYRYDRYGDPDSGYLSSTVAPEGTDITLAKDSLGLLQSVTQGSKTRSYGYDARRYLTSMTDPEIGTTTFERDASGNAFSKTTGAVRATFDYDGLNRIKKATYAGTAGIINYGYNKRGQITSLANPNASHTYGYDANGNLLSDTLVVDGNTFTTSYAWNTLDGLQSITYPQSRGVVTYTPNALGRPTQATPFATSVSQFASGNPASITFGNGIVQPYTEDSAQRPTGVQYPIYHAYTYDGVGNVTRIDSQISFDTRTFTYDGVDRLKTFSGQNASGNFDYGASGNITGLAQTGRVSYNTYDVNERLISTTGALSRTYSYDALGNITSDGTNNYTFDQSSMLTCSNCGVPAKEVKYSYDGKGWRVMEERAGNRTYLVYGLRGELLYEYARYGKKWKKYAYVHGKHIATEEGSDATASVTAIAATPSTIQFGQSVTLTATVTPATLTGTITFSSGTTVLGTATLVNGTASLAVTTLSVGSAAITATYGGNADYQPSVSATASVTVNKKTATATIAVTPATGALAQTVTVNTTVTGGSPTGQVQILANGAVISTQTLTNGAVSFTSSPLAAGTTSFSANYLGDTQNTTATATAVAATRTKALPAMSLSTSATTIPYGNALTLSTQPAQVSTFAVTGAVAFKSGATLIGTAAVGGNALFTTNTLPVGTYAIKAEYAGDSNYLPNTTATVNVTVTAAATTVTLGLPPAPLLSGRSLVFNVTVAGVNPSGQVRLMQDSVQIGAGAIVNGSAQITARLNPGTRTIRADYLGDANNAPSSSTGSVVVVKISPEDLAAIMSILNSDDN